MSDEEFFKELVSLYVKAREIPYPARWVNRARCRSVSGQLEDLLAYYVSEQLPERFEIFVDQPVSLGGRNVRYPDLVLLHRESGLVTSVVDVKTDLGWKRGEIRRLCQYMKDLAVAMAGRQVTVRWGDWPEDKTAHPVAPHVSAHVVVASWENADGSDPDAAIRIARDMGVHLHVLSRGRHPNYFSREYSYCDVYDGLEIRSQDMRSLIEALKEHSEQLAATPT